MKTSIERALEESGRAVISTTGVSMEPLLHHRKSSVVLVKPDRPLKKNDVVLFRRNEEYVLHRIIRRLPDGRYRIKGDNCFGYDDVPETEIIGLMEGYFADESGAYTRCGSEADRRYIRTVPIRHVKIYIEAILYRLAKRIGLR